MTAQHTKGPWDVVAGADPIGKEILFPNTSKIGQGPEVHVASVKTRSYDHMPEYAAELNAANARLIAAAPELLGKLKTAIRHIEHMAAWIGAQNAGYSFESLGEDMPNMQAAVAKATGAEQ